MSGLNYTYAVTPTTLFTLGANYLRSLNLFTTPVAGTTTSPSRLEFRDFRRQEETNLSGCQCEFYWLSDGFGAPWGTPGRLWFESQSGKASANMIRGSHSMNVGYEYNNRTTYGRQGLAAPEAYLALMASTLGWLCRLSARAHSDSARNYPIQTFGMHTSPYSWAVCSGFLEGLSQPNGEPRAFGGITGARSRPFEETLPALIWPAERRSLAKTRTARLI